jgi:hypothetical protein
MIGNKVADDPSEMIFVQTFPPRLSKLNTGVFPAPSSSTALAVVANVTLVNFDFTVNQRLALGKRPFPRRRLLMFAIYQMTWPFRKYTTEYCDHPKQRSESADP